MSDLPLFATHSLPVSGGHVLSVQEFGAASGRPAVVVHGGPGSAQTPMLRNGFMAADAWRVVCIDQRGCGASQPRGSVLHNTTADLVDDMELVRRHLGIDAWLLVGGSWGAALALAYACAHPQTTRALVLRSTFVARRSDVAAFFAGGPFAGDINTILRDLGDAMLGNDDARRHAVAMQWWRWERERQGMRSPADEPTGDSLAYIIDRYRVQSHYLANDCWLAQPSLIERAAHLARVPVAMLHGQADQVCPIDAAEELALAMPQTRWRVLPGVQHDPTAATMVRAMHELLAAYARSGHFDDAFTPHPSHADASARANHP